MSNKYINNKININKKNKFSAKKAISILMSIALFISIIQINMTYNIGATELIDWRKNDVMDINLNIINNKAGADDVLFQMDVEAAGSYELTYFLEDGLKTTVTFDNRYEAMDVFFKVQEYNPDDPTKPIERTQDLIDAAYLDIDYTAQVPGWQFNGEAKVDESTVIGVDGATEDIIDESPETLDFTIDRSASAKYPGIAFKMNNKKFIAKWDFQENMLYVLFDGYENGHIMPVTFKRQENEQTIKVLKGLEDFTVTPTYLTKDPSDSSRNIENPVIVQPNDNGYKPGNRPGLKYNFKQPKEIDETWTYSYKATNSEALIDFDNIRATFAITDMDDETLLDFYMLLDGDNEIKDLPAENSSTVNYTYEDFEYEVLIVTSKSGEDESDDLAESNTIIEWNDLEASSIYKTYIGFTFESYVSEYEFGTFIPESNFIYTYLDYQIERTSRQEAYIEIEPYETGEEYNVEYIVLNSPIPLTQYDPDIDYIPSLDVVNDLWLKYYQSESDGDGTINIPVPFEAASSQDNYQIIVNFSNTEMISQVLTYEADKVLDIPPTTPKIEEVENIYVVPPETEESENPSKIQFDLTWDAIENEEYTDLDDIFADGSDSAVYYEVLVNDIPNIDDADHPYEVFKIYEVSQVVSEEGAVSYELSEYNKPVDEDEETPSMGYNSSDGLLWVKDIDVYENDLWTSRFDTVYDKDTYTYQIDERTDDLNPDDFEANFEFPGINYVRIRVITKKGDIYRASNYSVPVSLSLSMLEYDIPIVEDITYEPLYSEDGTEAMGVELNWPAIDINDYDTNMLYPVDKEATGITYSVYLSEDREGLLSIEETNDNYRSLNELNGEVVLDNDDLSVLRDEFTDEDGDSIGNILYFEVDKAISSTSDVATQIKGLDENKNYYVRVVVDVAIDTEADSRRGDFSAILSLTTPLVPTAPGDDEILPLAPENLIVDFLADNQLITTLEWTIPEEISVEADTFGFEILSVENLRLPDDLKGKEMDIVNPDTKANTDSDIEPDDIIYSQALEDRETEAWRVYYEEIDGEGAIVLKKYNKVTEEWDIIASSLEDEDESLINALETSITITDDDNKPNRVMYYYVRTINVLGGEMIKASSWVEGTKTTAPISGVTNLIVDYNSEFTYDANYESIIRFDAPIPKTASVDDEFIMDIYVKGEDDLDYTIATKDSSTIGDDTPYYAEYLPSDDVESIDEKRIYYRISGLKAGKQYYIKVLIKEPEILEDGSVIYHESPLSDKVTTRTDFSQDDYDVEVKYEQYIDYYLKKAEALKQVPYYTLEQDEDVSTAKYRMDYVDGSLQISENSNYELVAFDKQTSIYYLPAEMLETGNELNINYVFEPEGQLIALKPYSMGEVITEEINNVINKINDYDASLEDYYIQIVLSVGDYSGKINGMSPSSKLVDIEVNVIGSEEVEDDIEIYLEDELDQAIIRGKEDLIDELEDELDQGINDSKLTEIVQEVLVDVSEDFSLRGQNLFDSYLDTTSYPIIELEKPILIGLSPDDLDSNNSIYGKITGNWKVKASSYYDNKYNISSYELGSFVAVNTLNGASLVSLYSTKQAEIINKYMLDNVFTTDELRTPTDTVTNIQMIQTLSRLIGANSDTDTASYLKEEGINVPYVSEYSVLNREVAHYLYVQIYAKKHQIDLNSVVIRDYNAIEDLSSINSSYRTTMLKGVSLGIIDLNLNRLLPANQMTNAEFFGLIENIE